MTEIEHIYKSETPNNERLFDYSYVMAPARIALYDDLLSVPQIIEIPPAPTTDFIGALSSEIYNQAHSIGGGIPFTAIKQVAENFIHAHFQEIVVSILDKGNTIRFSDQGPGIKDKEKAQQPGFSSATFSMKQYIDGVGSGLPIVKEYLDIKHGHLYIEDNLNGGSVITLTLTSSSTTPFRTSELNTNQTYSNDTQFENINNDAVINEQLIWSITTSLSKRGKNILLLFLQEDLWGVQDIADSLKYPLSSTHSELKKLEEFGLIDKLGTKRILSPIGRQVVTSIK